MSENSFFLNIIYKNDDFLNKKKNKEIDSQIVKQATFLIVS